ncbi:MAG: RNA 2',3'-cyclic phosphodiesterase [Candidatus Zixiibacteriota bacterium]
MRTFIAVELPPEVKRKIEEVQAPLKKTDTYVSWVKPGNVHLTLKFLGEVEEERIEDVFSGTERALKGSKAFKLSLKDLGCFPNLRRPRVVWLGVDKGKDELSQIQREIEEELSKLKFPKEQRPFSAHLTIGRVKSPKNIEKLISLIETTNFQTEEVVVDEVVVMRSQLHPQGAIYTPLKKIKLLEF